MLEGMVQPFLKQLNLLLNLLVFTFVQFLFVDVLKNLVEDVRVKLCHWDQSWALKVCSDQVRDDVICVLNFFFPEVIEQFVVEQGLHLVNARPLIVLHKDSNKVCKSCQRNFLGSVPYLEWSHRVVLWVWVRFEICQLFNWQDFFTF